MTDQTGAAGLVDWLTQQIDAEQDELDPRFCDCEIPGLRIEHGVRCDVRLLSECAAKRKLIQLHQNIDGACMVCAWNTSTWSDDWHLEAHPCPTLRLLAEIYRDRPGWRDEWSTE